MSDRITSVQNPRIRRAAQLRERDGRESQQRFLIDGVREIDRALRASVELDELFVCEASLRRTAREVLQRAIDQGVRPCYVSRTVQARLVFGERDEGLVACARRSPHGLAELKLPREPIVAVLAGVEKPGNVGAVIRSADAAGISAVIVASGRTDLFNPNAIRASLGVIFSLPVRQAPTSEVLSWLRARGCKIFAARVDGAAPYTQVDYRGHAAIVLGSEARGLDADWSAPDITPIALPMRGRGDSLNVSAAAAVMFYEALRQRS